jgi:hypothetical protein
MLIRNPYDRFVSAWKFFSISRNIPFETFVNYDFSKFNDPLNYHYIRQQTGDLIVDDKLIIDYFIRFEEYQKSFNEFCDMISIPKKKLPHERKSNHKPYKEYYTEKTANKIYGMFENDFKYLNYDKDSWK